MNCLNLRQNDIVLHRAGVRLNYFVVESCTRRGVYVLSPISWNGQSFIRGEQIYRNVTKSNTTTAIRHW